MTVEAQAPPGAARALYDAGYTDLVSVIPPGAPISQRSQIDPSQRGKCPGKRGHRGWYGYDWIRQRLTEHEIELLDSWGANVGILGDRFPGLDIDSEHPDITRAVMAQAREFFGYMDVPVRTSREPRRLLVFRTGEPFPRRALKLTYHGREHTIEWLGRGRQYLVHGRHPSGADYGWEGAPLWDWDPEEIPEVTGERAAAFLDHLATKLFERGISCEVTGESSRNDGPPPPQEELRAPSLAELERVVGLVPNSDALFPDREDYIRFGHAVKAAGGDGALPVFMEWCDRWDGGVNDPDVVEADWGRMRPPFRIGWQWLRERAGDTAQDEFEVDPAFLLEDDGTAADPFRDALQLADGLGGGFAALPDRLELLGRGLADLPRRQRQLVEASALSKLRSKIGSEREARRVLQSYAPLGQRSAFTEGPNGEPVLRPLTADDIGLEVRWLVEGRLKVGSVGVLVSDFSLGKTWLVIDLALSVAFGRPWLGSKTTERPVVFLIAEGNHDFPLRVFGWLVEHDVLGPDSTPQEMFGALNGRATINRYPTRFDDPAFERGLTVTIEQAEAGLVVIDTLGKTLGRKQPENDNDVANEITGMFSEIAARTGCATLFTHHVGYAAQDRVRGASGWEQGLDVEYVIEGTRHALESGKAMGLKCRKMRDAPRPPTVHYSLKRLPGLSLTREAGGEPLIFLSAVIRRVNPPPTELPIDSVVFQHIEANPGGTITSVRDAVGKRRDDVKGAIFQLERLGAIENRGQSNRHEWHAVAGWLVGGSGQVANVREEFGKNAPHDDEGEA